MDKHRPYIIRTHFLTGRGRPAKIFLWLLFAVVVLINFYAASAHFLTAGQNPLEIIRSDGGTSRLETVFWAGYAGLILSIGLFLPGKWFSTARPAVIRAVVISILAILVVTGVVPRMPSGGEALQRTGQGLLGAGMVLLSGWTVGSAALHRLPAAWSSRFERFLFEMLLGLGLFAYLLLGLAWAGRYTPPVVRWVTAFLAGAGVVLLLRQAVRWQRSRVARSGVPSPVRYLARVERPWLAVILAAGLVALVGALAPEVEFDALWYHLWLPRLWLEQGRPLDLVSEYVSLYPLQWELLYGAALSWGGAVASKLVNFATLPLLAGVVFLLARKLLPETSPWLAAALLVSTPTLLWESTTAYNDLALAAFVTLAIYSLTRFLEARSPVWFGLTGTALGLALAVKHLALFALLLLVLGLFALLLVRERSLRKAVIPAASLAGFSLLFPLPWYIRSALASGNPFFPELYELFGAFPAGRWDVVTQNGLANFNAHFGGPRTAAGLLALPWNMTIHAAGYGGSLGVLFLLLLPGLLVGRCSKALSALAALAGGYLLLWASPASSFQMRFLIPLVPVLALLGAAGYARIQEGTSALFSVHSRAILQGGVALIMLANLPPFVVLQETDRQEWNGWLTHVIRSVPVRVVLGAEPEQEYLNRKVPSYAAWQYINTHLPARAKILSFVEGDHFYSQRERLWSNATLARPATWGAPAGQAAPALAALEKLGITHILVGRALLDAPGGSNLAILQPDFASAYLTLEYDDGRCRLYRLNREALP